MMTFLRRRDRGQDRSPTIAETFVALKPRATSSGYGDLIELAATAASGKQGRKDEGSARPMAHFTVRGTQNLLSGDFDGRLGQGSPDECGLDQARLAIAAARFILAR